MITTKDSVRLNPDERSTFATLVGGEPPKSRGAFEFVVESTARTYEAEAAACGMAIEVADDAADLASLRNNQACASLLAAITRGALLPKH